MRGRGRGRLGVSCASDQPNHRPRNSRSSLGTFGRLLGRGNLTWTPSNPATSTNNVWVRPTLVRARSGPRRLASSPRLASDGVIWICSPLPTYPGRSCHRSRHRRLHRSRRLQTVHGDGLTVAQFLVRTIPVKLSQRFSAAPTMTSRAPSGSPHLSLPVLAPAKLSAAPVVDTLHFPRCPSASLAQPASRTALLCTRARV